MSKTQGYQPPEFKNEITLRLSSNESKCAISDLDHELGRLDSKFISQYPSHIELQRSIAQWIGVETDRIVVTAGGDDSIDRVLRNSLAGKRKSIVTHAPSFEMVDIYAKHYDGIVDSVEWLEGDFPLTELVDRIDSNTAIVVLTTPNNPTGGSISAETILEINKAAKTVGAKLLVDNAYIEFADDDPTQKLIANDNLLIVRTFSKAWGLAGLRVGYLIAPDAQFANVIRNLSGPFPVSAVSLETARRALSDYKTQMTSNLATIKTCLLYTSPSPRD